MPKLVKSTLADVERFQADIAAGRTRKSIKRVGRGATTKGGPGVAGRSVATLRAMLSHAVRWGLIDRNPALGVRQFPIGKRDRRLSEDELIALGAAMKEAAEEGEILAGLAAIELMLLTGFRRPSALACASPGSTALASASPTPRPASRPASSAPRAGVDPGAAKTGRPSVRLSEPQAAGPSGQPGGSAASNLAGGLSPRPSDGFFSALFGGPVPIRSPEGHIVGYYDHQAANEGLKITGAYAAVAPFFQPGSWMGDLIGQVAPKAPAVISEAIEEAISRHHPWPKYLGGPSEQELVPLRNSLHRALHSQLGAAMRKAGFPPVGGSTGSTDSWAEYFTANPRSREKAVEILRQVISDFDRVHGTSINPRLETMLRQNPATGLPIQLGAPVPVWPQSRKN